MEVIPSRKISISIGDSYKAPFAGFVDPLLARALNLGMLLIGSADCSSIQRLCAAFTLVRSPIPRICKPKNRASWHQLLLAGTLAIEA
jgi:hypothetical protein